MTQAIHNMLGCAKNNGLAFFARFDGPQACAGNGYGDIDGAGHDRAAAFQNLHGQIGVAAWQEQ